MCPFEQHVLLGSLDTIRVRTYVSVSNLMLVQTAPTFPIRHFVGNDKWNL